MPSPRTARLLLAAVLTVGGALCAGMWWLAHRPDHPVPTRAWDETMAAMDANPDVLLAFLAERTVVRDGQWDFRWMPAPWQHVWATLRFERGSGPPGPESPTCDEVAAAYRAMGLDEVAGQALQLGEALAGGESHAAEAKACVKAIGAARPRILAARRAYLEVHRQELEQAP